MSLLVFEIIKFFHHTQKAKTLYCKEIAPFHLKLNAAVIREGNRVRALCTRRPMAASPSQVKKPCATHDVCITCEESKMFTTHWL